MLSKVAFIGTGGTIARWAGINLIYSITESEGVDAISLVKQTGIQGKVAEIIPSTSERSTAPL
jgi:hypothetical protein